MGKSFRLKLQNWFYHYVGMFFITLAKARYIIHGFSPKPISVEEFDCWLEYDFYVVNSWLSYLEKYLKNNADDFIERKNILEVGPGSDIGIGLYLLHKGASRYYAIDIHNLIETVPESFYELFLKRLKKENGVSNITFLRKQLELLYKGNGDRLKYFCQKKYDLVSIIKKESIDIVFSQAAFEHIDNFHEFIKGLSLVVKPNAILVTEIDLMTHSRWIRQKDPNNIYRYNSKVYKLFSFKGSPNRIRPFEYKKIFEKYGWQNIRIIPLRKLKNNELRKVKNSLAKEFKSEMNQMDYLNIIFCATKS